jgi:hypothetical protein
LLLLAVAVVVQDDLPALVYLRNILALAVVVRVVLEQQLA